MSVIRKIVKSVIILALSAISANTKPQWTYELIGVETVNQTPDVVENNLTRVRLSRGLYAMDGNINIKQDLTDDFYMHIEAFISRTGSSNYVKTPFQIPPCKLSQYMNTFYKDLFMETLGECSENSPQFIGKAEMPVTKRIMILKNCTLRMENMPTYLTPGYYRIVVSYRNQANGSVSVDALVEPDF